MSNPIYRRAAWVAESGSVAIGAAMFKWPAVAVAMSLSPNINTRPSSVSHTIMSLARGDGACNLMEAVPSLSRIAVISVRNHRAHALSLSTLEELARKIDVTLLPLAIAKPEDMTVALETIRRERAQAFMTMGSPMFRARLKEMVAFAIDNRLPFMGTSPQAVRNGTLIAYGVNNYSLYRRLTGYVDKILKGANPAEMPVEEPTEYDFTVNLKTAKALGITLPPSILLRATEVIE